MRKFIVGALVAALTLCAAKVSAQDYRAEIMEHVIDPCYLFMAIQNPVDGVSPKQMADMVKALKPGNVEQMISGVNLMLKNNPSVATRMALYKLSLQVCISGAKKGR